MTRVIEDSEGNIYPVTNLFDENGCEIDDPARAETFVAKITETEWLSEHVDSIAIHTVH